MVTNLHPGNTSTFESNSNENLVLSISIINLKPRYKLFPLPPKSHDQHTTLYFCKQEHRKNTASTHNSTKAYIKKPPSIRSLSGNYTKTEALFEQCVVGPRTTRLFASSRRQSPEAPPNPRVNFLSTPLRSNNPSHI